MSFTSLALGLVFGSAAAFMLFAAWAALVLGQQTAWRWLSNKLSSRTVAASIRC